MDNFTFFASVYEATHPLQLALTEASGVFNLINNKDGWKCLPSHQTNLDAIRDVFKQTDKQFLIFHYAGHAFDGKLQFIQPLTSLEAIGNAAKKENYLVDPAGLAQMMTAANPLKLVFLNGCSTASQVTKFRDAKIPAVIATNKPLADRLGLNFANTFYDCFFNQNMTLQQAFDFAHGEIIASKNAVAGGWLNKELAGQMRSGGFDTDEDENSPLYLLHADEDFKQKKLADWDIPQAAPVQPGTVRLPEIHEDSITLCDRSDEWDTFEEIIGKLADGKMEGPVFFFIHELLENCPHDLTRRFDRFGLDDLCPPEKPGRKRDNFRWRSLQLPKRKHRLDPAECRSRLYEVWNEDFPCPFDEQKGRFAFTQRQQPDKVLLIHHDLNNSNVVSPQELTHLLDFYLGDFSNALKDELTNRIAVLFSLSYSDKNSGFEAFFEKRKASPHGNRIENLTGLLPVFKQEVVNWQEKVFKNRPKPKMEALYPFPEQERNMADISASLRLALQVYNKQTGT